MSDYKLILQNRVAYEHVNERDKSDRVGSSSPQRWSWVVSVCGSGWVRSGRVGLWNVVFLLGRIGLCHLNCAWGRVGAGEKFEPVTVCGCIPDPTSSPGDPTLTDPTHWWIWPMATSALL